MSGNSREHSRAYVVAVMESEDNIRPAVPFKYFMGTGLSFHRPADTQQGGQNTRGFS
jgi:hypothetical protein